MYSAKDPDAAVIPSKERSKVAPRMSRAERIELALRALGPPAAKDQSDPTRPIDIARLQESALRALESQQADRARSQPRIAEPEPPTAMLVCSDDGCFSSFEACEQAAQASTQEQTREQTKREAVMKRLVSLSTVARLIAAGMLFWAIWPHAYDYFTLLRFAVCAVAAYTAYLAYAQRSIAWLWSMGAIAVLFNPLVIVRLSRETWMPIDIGTGIVLLISIWFVQEKDTASRHTGHSALALILLMISTMVGGCSNADQSNKNASPTESPATQLAKAEEQFQNETERVEMRAAAREAVLDFLKHLPSWRVRGMSSQPYYTNVFSIDADLEKDNRQVLMTFETRRFFPESGDPYWLATPTNKFLRERLHGLSDEELFQRLNKARAELEELR